jgi:hypothetical protein
VFVTGPRDSPRLGDFPTGYATVAYDAASGNLLWQRTYKALVQDDRDAASLAVSPDGTKLFVSGTRYANGERRFVTIAYATADGKTLWVRVLAEPSPGRISSAHRVTVSPDGTKLVVTGTTVSSGGLYRFATIAYGATSGATLWLRHYEGIGGASAAAVLFAPNGDQVYVTGVTWSPPGGGPVSEAATVAYNASSGTQAWTTHYHPPGTNDAGGLLAVARDSTRLYVVGSTATGNESTDFLTIAYGTG